MFHNIFCKQSFTPITWSLLSVNVSHFQFLQGQEKQLTELEASLLQNSARISQLLKRKSYLLTSRVNTPSSCKTRLQPLLPSKQQIPMASQQVRTAADLCIQDKIWGKFTAVTAVCLRLQHPKPKILIKHEKQPNKTKNRKIRLFLKIMEIKEMKMKGNLVVVKHWRGLPRP